MQLNPTEESDDPPAKLFLHPYSINVNVDGYVMLIAPPDGISLLFTTFTIYSSISSNNPY